VEEMRFLRKFKRKSRKAHEIWGKMQDLQKIARKSLYLATEKCQLHILISKTI
jgi:hypothetical protein